jgi:hypothetical protein
MHFNGTGEEVTTEGKKMRKKLQKLLLPVERGEDQIRIKKNMDIL